MAEPGYLPVGIVSGREFLRVEHWRPIPGGAPPVPSVRPTSPQVTASINPVHSLGDTLTGSYQSAAKREKFY
jgi:hypothetical protein